MGMVMTDASAAFPISHALIYSGPTNPPQTNLLRNQIAFLNQPAQPPHAIHLPCTGLLIVLSSWGGNIFEARSLYGLIRALPFPVEINAIGAVQSAAVPLMLAADRRTASPDATFLFHPWTWGSEPHPGRSLDQLQQIPLQLEDDIRWAENTFSLRSGLKSAEIKQFELFTSVQIKDANFALKYGLVHQVIERKIPAGIITWNIA